MRVELAYGRSQLAVELPDERTTIIQPSHTPGLKDERGALVAALDNPIGARPLREWIEPGERICILFTDITRATPNDRIIPWLLDYLGDVPPQNITLLNQLGLDHTKLTFRHAGRDYRLTDVSGRVIKDLVS